MKRLLAPKFWLVKRKVKKFIARPSPGPHSSDSCIPLVVILRDILGVADNTSEAKKILNTGKIKVNGKIRKSRNYPIGLMDIIEIGSLKYRMLVGKKGLQLYEIDKNDSLKLMKIKNKKYTPKTKLQLNFHNGNNMILSKPNETYSTSDVLVIKDNKIEEKIPFEKGVLGLITNGNNIGKIGTVDDIKIKQGSLETEIIIAVNGSKILVPKSYVFVVGKEKPVINIKMMENSGGNND